MDFPHCPPLGGVIWDKNDLLGVTHAACNMLGFVGLLRPEAPKFIPHFKIYKVYSEMSLYSLYSKCIQCIMSFFR